MNVMASAAALVECDIGVGNIDSSEVGEVQNLGLAAAGHRAEPQSQ